MCDPILSVHDVSKLYQLYRDPKDRLKEAFHPFRKKYHQRFYALNHVSFQVDPGETVGIVGRNGSGKSTLLKIITGVLTPSSGRAQVNGKILALLELGAGFNPEISGLANIYFNGMLMGASKEEMDEKLDAILSFADIGDFVHQPVKTYSSGMYVRLAFAVIANMDADILVIDEALSVGDAFFTQKCMRFLRKFRENGTVLFVSHDTSAITNLCHRAIWLDKGEIKQVGKAKVVAENYLEAFYSEKQHMGKSVPVVTPDSPEKIVFKDQRNAMINSSSLRNDLEIFQFDPDAASFGAMGGKIIAAVLEDEENAPLSWVVGGEIVSLRITALAMTKIQNPIIGFIVKDKLGQGLFGDNTFITHSGRSITASSGETIEASFRFVMPIMPLGDYSICVALAEGSQENHIQHQWIHDAIIFKSHASSLATGLVGIPMENISLEIKETSGSRTSI